MASAISMRGAMFWMTYDGTMNSALFTEFMDLLIHDIDGKIFLIVASVKYHTSKETSEWVKEHRDRIELFTLPSYSPDLNPDEWVWKNVKNDHIARERSRSGPATSLKSPGERSEGFTRPRRKSGHSSRILTPPISVAPMPEMAEPPKI
jgi:transposase